MSPTPVSTRGSSPSGTRTSRGSAGAGTARRRHRISLWQFTRYGIIVTFLSTLMAWGYIAVRYFL
ncbi:MULTISPECIES: hypothetical protein [Thermomonosporaceae]|uniref:hypothetical protein n=1 Tax=Thermomonosporaceae TaxID=2012 RepID=UPI00255A8577|nr:MULTISPECIES: hypothetical protein [Thermomonosporaceae]MDL4773508.1 hypothetical protein [Actinomadura xylanilytica]